MARIGAPRDTGRRAGTFRTMDRPRNYPPLSAAFETLTRPKTPPIAQRKQERRNPRTARRVPRITRLVREDGGQRHRDGRNSCRPHDTDELDGDDEDESSADLIIN